MADPVALLREDGSPLTLEGATSITEDHPGEVTTHPVPDRSFSTDGRTKRPIVVTIEAVISQRSTLPGITTGPARLQEVNAWLLRASDAAEVLDIQQPDRAIASGYVIKNYKLVRDKMDGELLSLVLQQLRIATSETVTLADRQRTPTDAATAGLAEETDKGTTTTERSRSILDSLLFGGAGG